MITVIRRTTPETARAMTAKDGSEEAAREATTTTPLSMRRSRARATVAWSEILMPATCAAIERRRWAWQGRWEEQPRLIRTFQPLIRARRGVRWPRGAIGGPLIEGVTVRVVEARAGAAMVALV